MPAIKDPPEMHMTSRLPVPSVAIAFSVAKDAHLITNNVALRTATNISNPVVYNETLLCFTGLSVLAAEVRMEPT